VVFVASRLAPPPAINDDDVNYVVRTRRLVWPNLPSIALSSLIVCVGAVAVELLTPGITPFAVLLWAAIVSPLFGALVVQTNELVCSGSDQRLFSIFGYLRRSWLLSYKLSVIPAVAGALCLVALEVGRQTGSLLALVPAGLSGSAALLGLLAAVVALPLAQELPELKLRALLMMSLHVIARKPVPIIAVVAVGVLIGWAAAQFSVALVLLMPAPLAVLLVPAVWTSAATVGLNPRERADA
jgi:hypothetical protein